MCRIPPPGCPSDAAEAKPKDPMGANNGPLLLCAAAVAVRSGCCRVQLLLLCAAAVAVCSCCCRVQPLLPWAAAVAVCTGCCCVQPLLLCAAAVAVCSCCCRQQPARLATLLSAQQGGPGVPGPMGPHQKWPAQAPVVGPDRTQKPGAPAARYGGRSTWKGRCPD